LTRTAIVVIGCNEGERLRRCLDAAAREGAPIVYVDCRSTDGSPRVASHRGISVIGLDSATPLTAARARNAGVDEALRLHPETELVQFVDGDCELVPGWIERGRRALEADPRRAAVCGRVRERERNRSVYNLLCDLEWDAAGGEVRACNGNAMVRVDAFREVGGFDRRLVAGAGPELCQRLRRRGWRIFRSEGNMLLHDARMLRFSQWWRRSVRAGWAYAEGGWLHARSFGGQWLGENVSTAFWGALVPAAAILLAPATHGASLLLVAAYALLASRVYGRAVRSGTSRGDAHLQALFTVLGKFPRALGQAQFTVIGMWGGRRAERRTTAPCSPRRW
jgi:GT2 family glycosyltransferase